MPVVRIPARPKNNDKQQRALLGIATRRVGYAALALIAVVCVGGNIAAVSYVFLAALGADCGGGPVVDEAIKPSRGATRGAAVVIDPPQSAVWWLDDEPDDSYTKTYLDHNQTELPFLRPIEVPDHFSDLCARHRFDLSRLPTVSVVITVQNEYDHLLSTTVHSVLGRTPPELLKEIIVVDDNGEMRTGVDETEWADVQAVSPKVHIVRNELQQGCARSRVVGARVAKADVLVFLDSHTEEMSATWYQHLVWPIVENPRTVATQTAEIMSDYPGHHYDSGASENLYGVFSDDLAFGYQNGRFDGTPDHEKPNRWQPLETPFFPGSLFAIRRDEFWRLGGYDMGIYVWGGEHIELALKAWMCGGRVIYVPCSKVGHVYRTHAKELRHEKQRIAPRLLEKLRVGGEGAWRFNGVRADNITRIVTRNNLRVLNVWLGDHPAKQAYYRKVFQTTDLPPEWKQYVDELEMDEAARFQLETKEKNQCHDFEWFDKHVIMKTTGKHHPWHPSRFLPVSCGSHSAKSCAECPQGHGASWCNGHCTWCKAKNTCVPSKDKKACPAEEAKMVEGNTYPFFSNNTLTTKERQTLKDVKLTISVILPCGFEHETFARTAQSILAATPPSALAEIIVVDDASEPPLEPMFPKDKKMRERVSFVRLDAPVGLTAARQAGADVAKGDILVFFDCHVKPDPHYWEPFLRLIGPNYKRAVVPVITSLDADSWTEIDRPGKGTGMSKCYLTFDAEFKWTEDPTEYVPIMSGGLYAISRRWFFEIGGYDAGMKGWGGENLDQSLRIWRCGGEIVSTPDSYVAHMFRDAKHPARYKIPPGAASLNRAKAVKAHIGPWFNKSLSFPIFKEYRDGGKPVDVSTIDEGMKNLQCQSFEWYLQRFAHIYRDAGVLPDAVFQIQSQADPDPPKQLCLQIGNGRRKWGSADQPQDRLSVGPCMDFDGVQPIEGSQWFHRSNRGKGGKCCSSLKGWNTDQCIVSATRTGVCTLGGGPKVKLTFSGKLKVGDQCATVVTTAGEGPVLKGTACDRATSWAKRRKFVPAEFTLLSEEQQQSWGKDTVRQP